MVKKKKVKTQQKAPTVEERKAARRVLAYYRKRAVKILDGIDQEQPDAWIESLDTCVELLRADPETEFSEYRSVYKAGRELPW